MGEEEPGGYGGVRGGSVAVDPEAEGDAPGEFVALVVGAEAGGVEATFHVVIHVGRGVGELHGHHGLRVVHL